MLLGGLINLMIGSAAAWYTYSVYLNDRSPFLKHLAIYTGIFSLFMLWVVILMYVDGHPPAYLSEERRLLIREIGFMVPALLETGLIVTLAVLYWSIRRECVPRMMLMIGAGILFVVAGAYLVLIFMALQGTPMPSLRIALHLLADNGIILEIPILAATTIAAIGVRDPKTKRIAISFGYLYLSRYLVAILGVALLLSFEPGEWVRMSFVLGFMLLFNLTPFVWYTRFYRPIMTNIVTQAARKGGAGDYLAEQGLSKREIEIVEFLIAGKSNREIAASLFISLSTVKNHVHNLYGKLGIGSRYELLNLTLKQPR